jgi:hypothetical protein
MGDWKPRRMNNMTTQEMQEMSKEISDRNSTFYCMTHEELTQVIWGVRILQGDMMKS